jgi:hypothetical protein
MTSLKRNRPKLLIYLIPWIPGTEIIAPGVVTSIVLVVKNMTVAISPPKMPVLGFEIDCDNQDGSKPLCETDKVRSDKWTEQLKVPPDQRAVRDQRNYAVGARDGHLKWSRPKEHNDHADAEDQERDVTIIYPCGQFG